MVKQYSSKDHSKPKNSNGEGKTSSNGKIVETRTYDQSFRISPITKFDKHCKIFKKSNVDSTYQTELKRVIRTDKLVKSVSEDRQTIKGNGYKLKRTVIKQPNVNAIFKDHKCHCNIIISYEKIELFEHQFHYSIRSTIHYEIFKFKDYKFNPQMLNKSQYIKQKKSEMNHIARKFIINAIQNRSKFNNN
ncbi:hypothetical protein BN7_4049 [Wickerhamomyces ciferrii]|uniref:Uncharacterized protein n=1 Tax=Wickerhamomyces ciferrii (strain ATCC 14091 / BCRC 22168 / CBS 111 / JCM 3599 / NBRC 0793 / NRRL Y-1031 F-60-10) TaxID=1206466 RepID=K0KH06_WICCF|nr:uncharacterized protein BN7_4049 [Wickerhamomyces ciferrii]CCH44485.1 hypothetical protein BN7_4049 [Wickerhamomyces ciferrii]